VPVVVPLLLLQATIPVAQAMARRAMPLFLVANLIIARRPSPCVVPREHASRRYGGRGVVVGSSSSPSSSCAGSYAGVPAPATSEASVIRYNQDCSLRSITVSHQCLKGRAPQEIFRPPASCGRGGACRQPSRRGLLAAFAAGPVGSLHGGPRAHRRSGRIGAPRADPGPARQLTSARRAHQRPATQTRAGSAVRIRAGPAVRIRAGPTAQTRAGPTAQTRAGPTRSPGLALGHTV
jgi:hypothetical protein